MTRLIAPALLAYIFAIGGCSFDDPCEFDACSGPDAGGGNASAGNSANGGNNSNANNAASNGSTGANSNQVSPSDAGSNSAPNSLSPDAGMGDAGVVDSGMPNGNPNSTSPDLCQVDVFSFECADDPYEPNGSIINSHFIDSVGCSESSTPQTLDVDLNAQICPLESGDFFKIFLVPCAGRTATLEVEFDVETSCPADLYSFRLNTQQCTSGSGLTCERNGNRFTVTHDGRPTSPNDIFAIQFGIETQDDVFLDYSVSARSN